MQQMIKMDAGRHAAWKPPGLALVGLSALQQIVILICPDTTGINIFWIRKSHPARKMNVDGIYFDSMEWNWHHDLNYKEDHFRYTDYPLTFSNDVARPAIWNFASEFEFMKKISDEMHAQGKLAMGNGHGWNPFAAANLDLFGAELSWYSFG